MATPIHGFRSARAIVAYCGAVERPDPERPRVDGDVPPEGACPECVAVWTDLRDTLQAARRAAVLA